jgi:hypothetical protein
VHIIGHFLIRLIMHGMNIKHISVLQKWLKLLAVRDEFGVRFEYCLRNAFNALHCVF